MKRTAPVILFTCLVGTGFCQQLKVGDRAPALKVDRWLKGGPISRFEPGKVYVLEFWATWCGPCRVAMPHLTELAKKYSDKVTFIGMNIWEDQHSEKGKDYDKVIDKFMQENQDLMGYPVCTASKDDYMTKHWMKAAGQGGIPATFVVDQSGKIAWIGHPHYLDEPLAKILDGTFDAKGFAKEMAERRKAEKARQKIYDGFMRPINDALKKKDYDKAVEACDLAITKDPVYAMAYAVFKFEALMSKGPEYAFAAAQKIRREWDQVYIAAGAFVAKDGLDAKFYQFSLEVFEEQFKEKPQFAGRLAGAAMASFKLGNAAKAVEYQEKYMEAVRAIGAGEVVLRELQKELDKYKAARDK